MSAELSVSNAARTFCCSLLSAGLALFAFPHMAFGHDSWISRQQYSDPETEGFLLQ